MSSSYVRVASAPSSHCSSAHVGRVGSSLLRVNPLRCHSSPRIGQVHPQAQRAQRPRGPVLPMQGFQDISLPAMPSHQALKGDRSQGDQDVHRLQEETQDGVSRGILYKLRAGTEWLTKCAYVEHLRYVFECFRWFPVVKHIRRSSCCQASPRVHTRGPCSSEIVMFSSTERGLQHKRVIFVRVIISKGFAPSIPIEGYESVAPPLSEARICSSACDVTRVCSSA